MLLFNSISALAHNRLCRHAAGPEASVDQKNQTKDVTASSETFEMNPVGTFVGSFEIVLIYF